jgi:hypothetical protein
MNERIEERLAAATTALHEFHATTRLVEQLRARTDAAADELAVLRNRLDDEQADVDALEKPSLSKLFSSLRGGQADALAKERAEVGVVLYQVAEAKARFDAARAEHLAARDKLAKLANAPAEHTAALEAKERYLADSGDQRGTALVANAELRGRISGELREVRQALGAADNAHAYLSEMRERISKATLVSVWDVMDPGYTSTPWGDLFEVLDKVAEGEVYAAEWLVSLRAELADINEPMPELPDVAIRLPRRLWQLYVGGVPLNLDVPKAVSTAGNNTGTAIAIIDQLRTRLEAREAALLARLAAAEQARDALRATT